MGLNVDMIEDFMDKLNRSFFLYLRISFNEFEFFSYFFNFEVLKVQKRFEAIFLKYTVCVKWVKF